MTNKHPCEVKDCNGTYVSKTLSYANLRKVRTPEYNISVEAYNALEDKKGYHAVVANVCNICNDSLDDRLVNFLKNDWKPN